jgi:hypothetical protein
MAVAEMVDEGIAILSAQMLRGVANRTITKTAPPKKQWNFSKGEEQRYNMDASTLTGWTGGTPARNGGRLVGDRGLLGKNEHGNYKESNEPAL